MSLSKIGKRFTITVKFISLAFPLSISRVEESGVLTGPITRGSCGSNPTPAIRFEQGLIRFSSSVIRKAD